MNRHFKTLIAASAVAAVASFAGNASAGDSVENGCAATIGKNIAKYQATIAKNIAACHKSRNAGKLTDTGFYTGSKSCNDASQSDIKGKVPGARDKVVAAIVGKCTTGAANVLANYPTCPSPSSIAYPNTSVSSTIVTPTDLAKCLIGLSDAYVERMADQVVGNTAGAALGVPVNAGLSTCQNAVAKAFSSAVKTYPATYAKSQAAYSKSLPTTGAGLNYGVRTNGDPDSKASLAIGAVVTAVSTSCGTTNVPAANPENRTGPTWFSLDMCGQSVSAQQSCTNSVLTKQLSGLTGAIFEFPHTGANLQCASFADIVINAGSGTKVTNTRLDSGYTGAAHRVDVIDQSIGGVALSGCDANCANCDVNIDPTNGYCRCANNSKITCDTPPNASGSQPDADDCGGNLCNCFFGPPLPISATGNPVCIVNKFARSFTGGTTSVGSYSVGSRTISTVFSGINQLRPCPTCDGDNILNDGVKNGLCKYADEDPAVGACDANATTTLGNITNDVSFDCMPTIGAIGTLNLGLQFTDGTATISNPFTGATRCNAGSCHCSQCSADATVACNSNADCTAAGLGGTCGSDLAANNPKQNSCTAGVADCVADPANPGMGQCTNGPFDKYCDQALRQNGAGIIPCTNDASCDTYDSICDGGDCGSCNASLPGATRSCFLPSISTTGESGVFDSEGVSVFCSAQTGSSTINAASGLPGPTRVRLDFDFNILCDDHSTTYELPGGMNFP